MELARLYPAWVSSVFLSPQPYVQTFQPVAVLTTLKYSLLHRGYLSDLFGVDYPQRGTNRTQVNWVLWSYLLNQKIYLQSFTGGTIQSVTFLWPSATWLERELWEMFGVAAADHSDLRRLLTDYGFNGLPMRRDFPVSGYVEVRYSEKKKRVQAKPVSFVQEFRLFDFKSPWQN